MARTVLSSGRNTIVKIDNAQRLGELLSGYSPPKADWANPKFSYFKLKRYYKYRPQEAGPYQTIQIDRLGTSDHFPIEIQESDSDRAGTSAQFAIELEDDDSDAEGNSDRAGTSARFAIELEDDDSDTEGNPTEQSAGEVAQEI